MQAAPVATMKEMITSGSARKLLVVFTHFDEVKCVFQPIVDGVSG